MTFSMVARDPQTGELGVATATAGPAVGALVPHGRPGVGAIATQAQTNPYLAYDSLELLAGGDANAALAGALARDPSADLRQVVIVDAAGHAAAWTGSACQGVASHRTAENYGVAGNLLASEDVVDAMATAFEQASGMLLSERLLAALVAGAATGGDRRGIGSAAIKVFHRELYPSVDLRIDWSDTAIGSLQELHAMVVGGDYAEFFRQVPKRSAQ
jgi:uncharacterized Ntn-hydrolase superfamily protein